jgi:periplasmic divalent cation tolerance protein
MKAYLVALVTVPSKDVGRDVARALLDRKIAACVNIVPSISSFYTWEGEVCVDEELLLLIKTTESAFDELASTVKEIHPYDVPEVIAVPLAAGSKDYLEWIQEVVRA